MSDIEEDLSVVRRDVLTRMPIDTVRILFRYLSVFNLVNITFNDEWDIYCVCASRELTSRGYTMTPKKMKIRPTRDISPSFIWLEETSYVSSDEN